MTGEWFVFTRQDGDDLNFCISTIPDDNYLVVKLGKTRFQIARIQ